MKLKAHLVLLVISAVIPLLIFSFVVLDRHLSLQREERFQSLLDTSRALSLAVDREISTVQGMLQVLAASPYLDTRDYEAFYRQCRELTTEDAWIVLLRPDGQQIINTLKPFGTMLPKTADSATLEAVVESGRPVVTDLFHGAIAKRPTLSIDVPVFRDGRLVYSLDMSFTPERFTKLLKQQQLPAGYVAAVLDRKGILLARTLDAGYYVGKAAAADLSSRIGERPHGFGSGRSHEGVPLYFGFTRSEISGWTTAIGVSHAAADGPIRASISYLLGGGALLLLAGLGAALVFGKRIAAPIMALARSSEALQRGEGPALASCNVIEVNELQSALVSAGATARQASSERERRMTAEARQLEAEVAQEELRRRERHYLTLVENLPDIVFRLDRDLRHLYISPSVEKSTARKPEQFIGKTGLEAGLPEEIWQPFQSACDEVLKTGTANSLEFAYRTPKGLRYFQTRIIPERGANGSVESLLGMTSDISERKFETEALAKQTAQISEILEKSSTMIFVKDLEGRYIYVNRQAEMLFGDIRGKTDVELFSAEFAEMFRANDAAVLKTGEPLTVEERAPRPDGAHTYLATKFPLADTQGRVYGVCGISVDITERKRVEEALQHADQRKDEFLAILGHELRNPIGVISTAVQLLGRLKPPPPENVQMIREMIERQVVHTSRLLDDLLDVSRISRGKIQLNKQNWDLRDIVRQTGDDYRSILDEKVLNLNVTLPETAVAVYGDRTRLAQVMGNLIHNAYKFTEPGGAITLTLEEKGGRAIISVQDTGIGIEPAMLKWVLEPFSQAEHGLDRSGAGLGLGLALVKGIVELHAGEVDVASQGIGHGTTVTISLPLAEAQSANPPSAAARDAKVRPQRVLIIEDNPIAAGNMRLLMELSGHAVEVANSGLGGIEAARKFRPEIVLCDIGLPGLDGYRVAAALRQQVGLTEAQLIAVSGYAQDERRAQAAGFNAHIMKPVDFTKLELLLATLTQQRTA
jgi:PAS domain S-box-containing protein